MSDIGLILNGFLGVLLIGALLMGWRLERRLKALKASHQSFARSVEDLDRAASRAEQGLADLRAATDEAAETLAGRIERAGGLCVKLERLTADATEAEARLTAAPRPAATRDSNFARFAERYGRTPAADPAPVAPTAPPPRATRTDLILEDELAPAPAPRADLATRLQRLRDMAQPDRSRSRLDEALFEDDPTPRRAAGGRR